MMKRLLPRSAAVVAAALFAVRPATAANYYFSSGAGPGGSGSESSPWSNLSLANSLDLNPGDNLYLSGVFDVPSGGGLHLTGEDAGTAANPVKITSWGSGKAQIRTYDDYGIRASNVGGIEISNLHLVGSGPTSRQGNGLFTNNQDGIRFLSDQGNKYNYVNINNVFVEGYGENGINIQGNNGASGFNNVAITNVQAYKNQRAGVSMKGDFDNSGKAAHTNVYIGYVKAYENTGRPIAAEGNSGSGIVIGQVTGGVIEKSVAHHNGYENNSNQGGPIGIWAWDSDSVVIQKNEAYNNGTAGHHDGGGFDLDGGMTNSVMQYNYSHDNDGAGYLLAQFSNAHTFENNTVRFNVSQNDGRKNGYGGIHSFGRIGKTAVYNNTVFIGPALKELLRNNSDAPAAVKYRDGTRKDISFYNNLLLVSYDGRVFDPGTGEQLTIDPDMLELSGASGTTFLNNNYWKMDGSPVTNSLDALAKNLNPQLFGAGQGPTFDNADDIQGLVEYMLKNSSALIDKGIDLAQFGIDMGLWDFYSVPRHGLQWDIGANESLVGGPYVPEPTAAAAVGLAAAAMLRRQRRRRDA